MEDIQSHEEKNSSRESASRVRLRELELNGNFVFHGTAHKLEQLEPRQAFNHPRKDSTRDAIPDDQPAVFASPFADIAVFRAIINKENAPGGARSRFGAHSDGILDFGVTKETFDQIDNVKGYVYVFPKEKFKIRNNMEGLSYEPVKPVDVIEVTESDLPDNIIIGDF